MIRLIVYRYFPLEKDPEAQTHPAKLWPTRRDINKTNGNVYRQDKGKYQHWLTKGKSLWKESHPTGFSCAHQHRKSDVFKTVLKKGQLVMSKKQSLMLVTSVYWKSFSQYIWSKRITINQSIGLVKVLEHHKTQNPAGRPPKKERGSCQYSL